MRLRGAARRCAAVVAVASFGPRRAVLRDARAWSLVAKATSSLRGAPPPERPLVPLSDAALLRSTHYVSGSANWLLPGRVLVGRYPGTLPGETTEAAIGAIASAGVDTFVCLQAEVPAHGGAAYPAGLEPYADLARAALAPLGREPAFVHLGIPDLQPAPRFGDLVRLVDDLADRVERGRVLYIHCWGGKGRTGLVAACLLLKLFGGTLTPDDALARLGALIRVRLPDEPAPLSPETDAQRAQVRAYYRRAILSRTDHQRPAPRDGPPGPGADTHGA